MRLTPRLVLSQTIAIAAVLVADCWLQLGRERALFMSDVAHDHQVLGRAIAGTVDNAGDAARVAGEASRAGRVLVTWLPDYRLEDDRARFDGQIERGIFRSYYPIVLADGQHLGAFRIDESAEEASRFLRTTILSTLVTTLVAAIVLAALTALFGVALVGRRTRELMIQARRIGAGDLSEAPIPKTHGDDEINELGREMNAMAVRLARTIEALRRADRLVTVGQLASGLAHELGTPMNIVVLHAERIAATTDRVRAKESAEIIAEQTDRMAQLLRQLLDFARPAKPEKRHEDLHALALHLIALLHPLAEKRGVRLSLIGGAPPVPIDPAQLEQVITNLVVNAIQATERGGLIQVSIEPRGEGAVVRVRDSGSGIAKEDVSKLFDPFFTTKPVGSGTGLGLSIVHSIVREHGGWIEVDSALGSGTEFAVGFPGSSKEVHS